MFCFSFYAEYIIRPINKSLGVGYTTYHHDRVYPEYVQLVMAYSTMPIGSYQIDP